MFWESLEEALRHESGHKSNRMVLNEAAQRLGVSLRQTEDQLMRDMLASTASFINCVGGVDGKNVAVVKSLLIDLEIRQDDKGQAKAAWTTKWRDPKGMR